MFVVYHKCEIYLVVGIRGLGLGLANPNPNPNPIPLTFWDITAKMYLLHI